MQRRTKEQLHHGCMHALLCCKSSVLEQCPTADQCMHACRGMLQLLVVMLFQRVLCHRLSGSETGAQTAAADDCNCSSSNRCDGLNTNWLFLAFRWIKTAAYSMDTLEHVHEGWCMCLSVLTQKSLAQPASSTPSLHLLRWPRAKGLGHPPCEGSPRLTKHLTCSYSLYACKHNENG